MCVKCKDALDGWRREDHCFDRCCNLTVALGTSDRLSYRPFTKPREPTTTFLCFLAVKATDWGATDVAVRQSHLYVSIRILCSGNSGGGETVSIVGSEGPPGGNTDRTLDCLSGAIWFSTPRGDRPARTSCSLVSRVCRAFVLHYLFILFLNFKSIFFLSTSNPIGRTLRATKGRTVVWLILSVPRYIPRQKIW